MKMIVIKKILNSKLIRRHKELLLYLVDKIKDIYAVKSYAQEGEDLILSRIFNNKLNGFYVDVGAHHPHRFSNTNLFYIKGWNGINIEPNPNSFFAFCKLRPRDINLQVGISTERGYLRYYSYDEQALNTFDKNTVSNLELTTYKLQETLEIPVERLDYLLDKYLPSDQTIDFLTIDVEGFDFQVLQSNDWTKYKPKCVLVEVRNLSLEKVLVCDIFLFMKTHGYELFAKTFNTLILLNNEIE
jgi:FkbM family methyltransferase